MVTGRQVTLSKDLGTSDVMLFDCPLEGESGDRLVVHGTGMHEKYGNVFDSHLSAKILDNIPTDVSVVFLTANFCADTKT